MSDVFSQEVAKAEFERFADAMDIEIDEEMMEETELKSFLKVRASIIKVIKSGRLTINDRGEPTLKLFEPVGNVSEITFKEPLGKSWMAADQKKQDQTVSRFMCMVQDASDLPEGLIGKVKGRDFKTIQNISLLFFA